MAYLAEQEILELLKLIKSPLDGAHIPYWLGRGVFRHLYLHGVVGDRQSDIDIHIWREDSDRVKTALSNALVGFNPADPEYKLAFTKDLANNKQQIIEFMYLDFEQRDPDLVYHKRAENMKLYCPKECFPRENVKTIRIGNIEFRVPSLAERYFEGTYGLGWKLEDKYSC
jgi:hypothetical protein